MNLPPDGYRAVIFDCDSTLVGIEGIDELAHEVRDEVRALTDAAMAGDVALEDVYERRLELIRPDRERVAALGAAYRAALMPDAVETVEALCWLGKDVRIMSGGLRPAVESLARALGLRASMVAAVGIDFDAEGRYTGFERGSPLARAGGKAEQVRAWRVPRPALLVGDGATDAEARPEVDAFAAYMGVVHRSEVAEAADLVLSDRSLAPVLAIAAGARDRARLRGSRFEAILERALKLLPPSLAADRGAKAPG